MFPTSPSHWFRRFISKNHLPPLTFHQLRHTNASLLISQGVDIATVSKRLGHADKSITLRTYTHPIKQQIYAWVQKYEIKGIDGLVDGRGRTKPKEVMTENEKLKAQIRLLEAKNYDLEMENALIKKLKELEEGGH